MREVDAQTLPDWVAGVGLSSPVACPYWFDRPSQYREFRLHDDEELPPEVFADLLDRNFRRCGNVYYRPECPRCTMCRSLRIPLADFAPSRNQRRVLRRNADLECRVDRPRLTIEKADLYLRYQYHQHHHPDDGPFDARERLESMHFQMFTNPRPTREIEFRQADGRLLGFGILDVAAGVVSAVYFVFDPEAARRSLGTLAILRGIQWARQAGHQWYHLGYHIAGHPKMDYKARFRPHQLYHPTGWGGEDKG